MPDVIAIYFFIPEQGTTPDEAAQAICEEETTGTWTDISTRTAYVQRLDGTVESVEEAGEGYVTNIHFPA